MFTIFPQESFRPLTAPLISSASAHIPVLLREVLEFLNPQPNETYVDMTLGLGGHAREILLKTAPKGRLLAFEHDPRNRSLAEKNLESFADRVTIFPKNFSDFPEELQRIGIHEVDGILFDLGISSLHLDEPERGFSFRNDGPLDMRMNPENPITAADIIAESSEEDLTRIFREYGEEPSARYFAREIAQRRETHPFARTAELAEFLKSLVSPRKRSGGGHPATLVFQALRIAVNRELDVLEETLPKILPFLKKGGRVAVISFHSLEDRIVKKFFHQYAIREKRQKYPTSSAENSPADLQILTSKPIFPSLEEVEENPRARSARLRVAEKMSSFSSSSPA